MEVVEETFGANCHFHVVKGQRAKRPRPSPPSSLASTSSIGCTSSGGGEERHIHGHGNDDRSSYSAAMSNTEEDEDMANCLILLAQGRSKNNEQGLNGQKSVETREGLYAVYECKTCNRSFPSFQALGGHAASHKKPKAAIKEEKKGLGGGHININNTNSDKPLLQADHHHMIGNNNKSKVHECSICGSEFSSGQALGGHMRRHRNIIAPMVAKEEFVNDQKSRKVLGLDLNLPAPDEQPPLVFSAPALVDCHY